MVHERRASVVLLTESACAVALSVLLGNLRLLELPNGGSIALATLPLLTLALSRGVRVGVLAGLCAGIAHALAGGVIVHPIQLLLDYPAAYAALGLAGIASGRGTRRTALAPGIIVAMSCHLAAMAASGVVFFAPVAGDGALAYALAYNLATVGPETALALWLTAPLLRATARANPADAWRRGLLDPPHRSPRTPRTYRPTHAPTPIDTPHVSRSQAPDTNMRQHAPARTSFLRPTPFTTASTPPKGAAPARSGPAATGPTPGLRAIRGWGEAGFAPGRRDEAGRRQDAEARSGPLNPSLESRPACSTGPS